MAAEKIASTGLARDPQRMYFVKQGDVWSTTRKRPGKPKGTPRREIKLGIKLDYSKYLYYLDDKLNVMRSRRK
jgi:hypothetical protein